MYAALGRAKWRTSRHHQGPHRGQLGWVVDDLLLLLSLLQAAAHIPRANAISQSRRLGLSTRVGPTLLGWVLQQRLAACRLVGVNCKTGTRWSNGRRFITKEVGSFLASRGRLNRHLLSSAKVSESSQIDANYNLVSCLGPRGFAQWARAERASRAP